MRQHSGKWRLQGENYITASSSGYTLSLSFSPCPSSLPLCQMNDFCRSICSSRLYVWRTKHVPFIVLPFQYIRDLKQDDNFNRTWWPNPSVDKCCQVTSLSIERTNHQVLLKALCCLRYLLSRSRRAKIFCRK